MAEKTETKKDAAAQRMEREAEISRLEREASEAKRQELALRKEANQENAKASFESLFRGALGMLVERGDVQVNDVDKFDVLLQMLKDEVARSADRGFCDGYRFASNSLSFVL